MWAMKTLHINILNNLTEEEQVEFWFERDKQREPPKQDSQISHQDIKDIFQAY